MSKKRKISIRKILQVFVTLVVTTACIMAISSATKIENQKTLTGIDIDIKNGRQYHFINEAEVHDMLIDNRHIDITHIPVNHLDIQSMENILVANPWVSDAQVYVDNQRRMHVNVVQRAPVARVFDMSGNSYYLDTTLKAMPLSDRYVYYTTVVTNVPELKDDSMGHSLKAQIVSMVRYIEHSKFWNAQVSQIAMDLDYSFELVPVLGDQRIMFGDTTRMVEKFNDLFLFYKNILNRIGWDKYKVLDLRYKDQVVAAPSLPWKAPSGKAMSNMDWVKSIIENGAQKEGITDVSQPVHSNILNAEKKEKEKSKLKKEIKQTINKEDKQKKRNH